MAREFCRLCDSDRDYILSLLNLDERQQMVFDRLWKGDTKADIARELPRVDGGAGVSPTMVEIIRARLARRIHSMTGRVIYGKFRYEY